MKLLLALLFLSAFAHGQRLVTLPRRTGNDKLTVYLPTSPFLPGDTVELEGDYLWIQVKGIKGTAQKPIIFRPKGKVTVGGFKSYTMILEGEHWKLLGGCSLTIGKPGLVSMGLNTGPSHHIEVADVEMQYVTTGIQQNPIGTGVLDSIYYHRLNIHDMSNPAESGRAEAFYIGQTKAGGMTFNNLRIEDNTITDVSGDGIQVAGGTFSIKRNVINGYGLADLVQQNNGILVGDKASADIWDNTISTGTGPAIQILGIAQVNVVRNSITGNRTTRGTEDLVYINGRSGKLAVLFEGNTLTNNTPARKVAFNGTAPANNGGVVYRQNQGLAEAGITKVVGDVFTPYIPPIIPPTKRVIGIYKVYDDGSIEKI